MPLLAGSGSVVQPPAPTPSPLDEVYTLTWVAPDGTEWPLMEENLGWHALDSVSGAWDAAPIETVTDDHPRGGVRVRHQQPAERLIVIPIRVEGVGHSQLLSRWRALARAFTQTRWRGPGRLVVTRPDGTQREIEAYYESGWKSTPGQGLDYDTAAPLLLCEDPYWRDLNVTSLTRSYAAGGGVFLSPFMTISSGAVLGETVLTNLGDVEAWPTWTITGPMTSLTAANLTTGETLTLNGPLLAGETATIDTDASTITGPGGVAWTSHIDWLGSTLWGLVSGDNQVDFAVADAAAGTSITLSYRNRYETA